ncbi:MAG: hypothetical protein J6Y02_11880 [Pseudobutyrivibrio sp.]|nr:hypothetical protein [Pseudobutyrivibrio sp.]
MDNVVDVMGYLEKRILNGSDDPKVQAQNIEAYSRITTAYVKQQENEVKLKEVAVKQEEAKVKQKMEEIRVQQEADAAKREHRREVAKICISGTATVFSGVLGLAALKDGGLLNNLLRNWRMNKTL